MKDDSVVGLCLVDGVVVNVVIIVDWGEQHKVIIYKSSTDLHQTESSRFDRSEWSPPFGINYIFVASAICSIIGATHQLWRKGKCARHHSYECSSIVDTMPSTLSNTGNRGQPTTHPQAISEAHNFCSTNSIKWLNKSEAAFDARGNRRTKMVIT